jgi:hypothetical protein
MKSYDSVANLQNTQKMFFKKSPETLSLRDVHYWLCTFCQYFNLFILFLCLKSAWGHLCSFANDFSYTISVFWKRQSEHNSALSWWLKAPQHQRQLCEWPWAAPSQGRRSAHLLFSSFLLTTVYLPTPQTHSTLTLLIMCSLIPTLSS